MWGSEGKGEIFLFLGVFLPQSLCGPESFSPRIPLTDSVLPSHALVCFASHTCGSLSAALSAGYRSAVLIAGNAPMPTHPSLALGMGLASGWQRWGYEDPSFRLRLGLLCRLMHIPWGPGQKQPFQDHCCSASPGSPSPAAFPGHLYFLNPLHGNLRFNREHCYSNRANWTSHVSGEKGQGNWEVPDSSDYIFRNTTPPFLLTCYLDARTS